MGDSVSLWAARLNALGSFLPYLQAKNPSSRPAPVISVKKWLETARSLRYTPHMSGNKNADARELFPTEHHFTDDMHGEVFLNALERDCIDSPEFQRLFRIGQLGFVDLVYQAANHTRGAHSIGVCFNTQRLIDRLNTNNKKRAQLPQISPSEAVLIRLGGLLHDIPHGPIFIVKVKVSNVPDLTVAGPQFLSVTLLNAV